jgi:peptidoglycan/xylan/chitin deacetylase (PgdA/CDA1 family)
VPEIPGTRNPGGRKVIALTFDDGPWRDTPAVLSVLRRERVRATFFEIGRQVAATPQISKELADAGMSVQIHTWDHRNLTLLTDARVHAEVRRTAAAIHRATGTTPRCVRPPDGELNRRVERDLARDGYVPVNWDVDSRDWARPGVASIVRRAVAGARPGGIVVLHDGGGDRRQTVAALPEVIAKLRVRGYSFVSLCQ